MKRRGFCLAIGAAGLLGACATASRRGGPAPAGPSSAGPSSAGQASAGQASAGQASAGQAAIAPEVVIQAMAMLGTPYRWGGEDPVGGFDCSGLVRHAYRRGAGLELPRRAEEMARVGTAVPTDALTPGDLVFFNTLGRPNSHVAIYIGDGRFVHAPAVRGVVRVEAMGERYWDSRFNGARRVLAAPGGPPVDIPSRRDGDDAGRGA